MRGLGIKDWRRHFSSSQLVRTRSYQLIKALRNRAPIDVHPEVEHALANQKAVVALETAIVTHGMPYPTNLETARSVEKIVRSTGSVPATIGMIGGRIKIGLEPFELERLADPERNPLVVKLSPRDFMAAIALKRDGGTTCSGTSFLCDLAGIKIFATGGLGGVHRGGEITMDVSADLAELARRPVGLVSAGVKSILDIGRTLEYLETLGVPVVSYAKTNDFPAFFSPRSGFKAPWNSDDPNTVARMLYAQWQLSMENGALIAVPIPDEYENIGADIQESVELAIVEAEASGVSKLGKEVTPWILKRVADLTRGKSLPSNVALIQNTALVGGQIAMEYARIRGDNSDSEFDNERIHTSLIVSAHHDVTQCKPVKEVSNNIPSRAQLIVIGSAAVDVTARADQGSETLGLHSTSPGDVLVSLGGVGRNIAEAAHRILVSHSPALASATLLVSPVGCDAFGRLLTEETQRLGMRTDGFVQNDTRRTAVCNMVLDSSGDLISGVADMDITRSFEGSLALTSIKEYRPRFVVLDGNLSPDTIKHLVSYSNQNDVHVFFEPASVIKSTTIFPAVAASLDGLSESRRSPIAFASPNLLELVQMYHASREEPHNLVAHPSWWKVINNFALGSEFHRDIQQLARRTASGHDSSKGTLSFIIEKGIAQMAVNLLPFFQTLIVKCGELGIFVTMRIPGRNVSTSGWAREQSDPQARCVVAHAKSSGDMVVLKHYPALLLGGDSIVNVTGAGDTFVGSILATLVQDPAAFIDPTLLNQAVHDAQRAASLTLQSHFAVSPLLSVSGSTHGQS